jgi:hypothetical protein
VIKLHKGTEFEIPEFGTMKSESYVEVLTRVKNLSAGVAQFTKLNSGGLLGIFEDTRKGVYFYLTRLIFRMVFDAPSVL